VPSLCAETQSDNGTARIPNPVIYSDFPDPDVIRVDSAYYMVSTTMFIFPGSPILKSYDLVNWNIAAMLYREWILVLATISTVVTVCPRAVGHSLKYKNGKYYLLFITLDEGGFICTATEPDVPGQ